MFNPFSATPQSVLPWPSQDSPVARIVYNSDSRHFVTNANLSPKLLRHYNCKPSGPHEYSYDLRFNIWHEKDHVLLETLKPPFGWRVIATGPLLVRESPTSLSASLWWGLIAEGVNYRGLRARLVKRKNSKNACVSSEWGWNCIALPLCSIKGWSFFPTERGVKR